MLENGLVYRCMKFEQQFKNNNILKNNCSKFRSNRLRDFGLGLKNRPKRYTVRKKQSYSKNLGLFLKIYFLVARKSFVSID